MDDVGMAIAIHIRNPEAFAPLSRNGQAGIEPHEAHRRCRRDTRSVMPIRTHGEECRHGQASDNGPTGDQGT
jgi:hypothetical protein